MDEILDYLEVLEHEELTQIIKYKIYNYLTINPLFVPRYFSNIVNTLIEICFNRFKIETIYILCDIISLHPKINIYNFYKFFLTQIISLDDSNLIKKYNNVLAYCLRRKYFKQNVINKHIDYYSNDCIWYTVKDYLDNYHYIYKGSTILNLSLSNLYLFDYLLTDAIDKKLYDPVGLQYEYYTNNYMLSKNLELDISIFIGKSEIFRTYILSKLPIKYKYLKNLKKVQNIITKNSISSLEGYFEIYKKFLTPNTRLQFNHPLLDFTCSIEMFYYLIKKGANINALTIEPTVFSYRKYNEYYFTNTLYNNPLFVLDNLQHYYEAGADFHAVKKVIRKFLKINYKLYLFHDTYGLYLYCKLLSRFNKYIRKTKNKVEIILQNKFCKDVITKVNEYI
jgi:hypothetical protein